MSRDPSFAPPLRGGVIPELALGGQSVADLAVTSFNGSIGHVTGLASFNGRTTAAAVPTSGDYTAAQVTNAADKGSTSLQSFAGGFASSHPSNIIGYTTGAGGSVTQSTSKSTAVSLNAPSGQIIMNGAALAAGASVVFNMTNTWIGAISVVVANINSLGSTTFLNYRLDPPNYLGTLNKGVQFRLTNVSAGSLSEAVIINFVVLNASLS